MVGQLVDVVTVIEEVDSSERYLQDDMEQAIRNTGIDPEIVEADYLSGDTVKVYAQIRWDRSFDALKRYFEELGDVAWIAGEAARREIEA